MSAFDHQLGENIREMRRAKGWQQKRLADEAGLATSTLSDIEKGKVDPKFSQVAAICQALGVDLNYAWGYKSSPVEKLYREGGVDAGTVEMYLALSFQLRKKVKDEIEFLHDLQQNQLNINPS